MIKPHDATNQTTSKAPFWYTLGHNTSLTPPGVFLFIRKILGSFNDINICVVILVLCFRTLGLPYHLSSIIFQFSLIFFKCKKDSITHIGVRIAL
jgi:hypothetical protein